MASYSSTDKLDSVSGDSGRIGPESGADKKELLRPKVSDFSVGRNWGVRRGLSYRSSPSCVSLAPSLSSWTGVRALRMLMLCRRYGQHARLRYRCLDVLCLGRSFVPVNDRQGLEEDSRC